MKDSVIRKLGIYQIPFTLVFTKIDKLSKNKLIQNVEKFKREMKKEWEELPLIFLTSAVTGYGREDILNFIEDLNKEFDAFGRKFIQSNLEDEDNAEA